MRDYSRPWIPMSNTLPRLAAAILLVSAATLAVAPGQLFGRRDKAAIGNDVRQLVVSVADSWDSTRGYLQCYQRTADGAWRPVFRRQVPVLFGRNGLAWGRGVITGAGARVKREGDGRAPAGVFRIGRVYGDPAAPPRGSDYPYHQVTRWDAWVDDPKNPYYNRHLRIDPEKGVPPWFEGQRMRLGDPAYHWLVEIRHNADPPRPGFGSAIFLHTRRGPDRKTAGCTTMARADLEAVIRFLRAPARPHYVLLPRQEYMRHRAAWGLPPLGG